MRKNVGNLLKENLHLKNSYTLTQKGHILLKTMNSVHKKM